MASAPQPDLAALLERAGVRPTRQRLEILRELAREPDDVTAQALWSRLRRRRRASSIGLATVYRTLALLHERGAVDALSHHGGELCYRLCGSAHHHHLVCTSCHRVVEIDECGLDDWVRAVAAAHDFEPTAHSVELSGLCADCR
jgi:Fur family transcriptional regulator, ferric uptake regulator